MATITTPTQTSSKWAVAAISVKFVARLILSLPRKMPTITTTCRKWRVAAISIMFIVRILSLTKKKRCSTSQRWHHAFHAFRASSRISPAPTTVVNIPLLNTTPRSFDPMQAAMAAAVVRENNHDGLKAIGGTNGVLASLCTNPSDGISSDTDNLSYRAKASGANTYPKLNLLLKNFIRTYIARSYKDVIFYASYFLSFGVRISGHSKEWKEVGGYMLVIALFYSVLSSVLDFGVEIYLDRSISFTNSGLFIYSSSSYVIRSGIKKLIPVSQIVVGDVILLKAGDNVPADGLLIVDNSLTVTDFNSVCITNPFMFSGSWVCNGTGKMVVTAVGTNTRLWENQAADSANHSTPLQKEVQDIIFVMKKVSFGMALLALIIVLARYFSGNSRNEKGKSQFIDGQTHVGSVLYMIAQIILVIVTIGLAMDSESYLWVVKICQGYNIKKMAADREIFVRKLSALEKIGSVTSIVVTERTFKLISPQLSEFKETGVRVVLADEETKNGSLVDSAILCAVKSLKRNKNVVALIMHENDEIVDLLALQEADVTVLISSGSDKNQRHKIAKVIKNYDAYVANITLFPSPIISLLRQGRCVIDNTRMFILFQLTAGGVSLLRTFICTVSRKGIPTIDNELMYSLLQLVWVNLILGFFAAIALSREEPQLKTREVNNKKRLIYGHMWRNIVAQICYQIALIQVMQVKGEVILGLDKKQTTTIGYVMFFSCQVLNMFNARKVEEINVLKGILKNKMFIMIVAGIFVMQVVFVEILNRFLGLEKLDWGQKFKCLGLPFGSLLVGVVVKLVPVPSWLVALVILK